MYLRSRTPLPIHYNPFMAFAMDPQAAFNDQLVRSTNLVLAIGRFKRSLDAQVLRPEVYHMDAAKSKTTRYETICR